MVIDTGGAADTAQTLEAGATLALGTHSLVVLREHAEPEGQPDHSVAASLASLADAGTVDSTPAADERHRHDQD